MRILVAADQWFPDHRGGLARVATDTSEWLASRGHEVTAIVPATRRGRPAEPSGRVRVVRGIRRGWLPQTWTDPREVERIARHLGGQFDVLVGHNSTTATGLLRGRPDVPLVTVFHASVPLEVEFLHTRVSLGQERARAYVVKPALVRYERLSLVGAARILVLSEFTRSLLSKRDGAAAERAILVPGAVDTDIFRPDDREEARRRLGIPADEVLILTVRRLVHRMGLEELVDATAHLTDVDRLRVAIVGQGPLRSDLEERVRSARLEGRIELIGRASDDELVDWYRAADLFVVPTVAYEGFGLVTAEALACGTPVVGTPVGATPELLMPLDPRLVALSADPEALAEALRLGLRLAGPDLSRRCRDFALDRFSWGNAIESWEREIIAAAGQNSPSPRPRGAVVRLGRALDDRVPFDLKAIRNGSVAHTREIIGLGVRATATPSAARHLQTGRRAGILLYHNPDPATLEQHLEYLSARHAFVPYAAVVEAVRSGNWEEVPDRSLAVSLDDGWADNVSLFEVFERFGVLPTIFVCTGIVGTSRRFWATLEGLDPSERDRLMTVRNEERLAALESMLGWRETREYPETSPQALSLEQLASLAGRVDVQAHTRFHPILPACDDTVARDELAASKGDVERLTGLPCLDFAYPNGVYGDREIAMLKDAGFRSARTIETGWNEPGVDPYRLRILGMPDNASLNIVAAQSTGLPGLKQLMYWS